MSDTIKLYNRVTIVTVTYNSAHIIGECLKNLDPNFAIIVVDNDSNDRSPELIESNFPHVKVVRLGANLGFGSGNNVALKEVQTEFALLVNPDAIIDIHNIKLLVEAADKYEKAGLLAPMLYDADGELHKSYKRSVFIRENKRTHYHQPEGDLSAEFISGAVMMLRMSALTKVGLFDSNIFMFYEDDDICLRMYKNGYHTSLVAGARAVHLQGKSSTPSLKGTYFRNKHMATSRLYLEQKYHGKTKANLKALQEIIFYTAKTILNLARFNNVKLCKSYARLAGSFNYLAGNS